MARRDSLEPPSPFRTPRPPRSLATLGMTRRCDIVFPSTGTRLANRESGGVFVKPVVRSFSVVVALLFLASCGSGGGGLGGASSISLDQEWQLGNQMAAQVAQQVHIVNDPPADGYLRKIGG